MKKPSKRGSKAVLHTIEDLLVFLDEQTHERMVRFGATREQLVDFLGRPNKSSGDYWKRMLVEQGLALADRETGGRGILLTATGTRRARKIKATRDDFDRRNQEREERKQQAQEQRQRASGAAGGEGAAGDAADDGDEGVAEVR